ncbi:ABC transporter transmembrane domain-containing protein [Pseudovibrio sp. SPO723]|uniref:ABC transporter transmembrane domain-containing protein n=1 Tax=Nesiotobacter zosterae TaxID=392721 RepID=UPI0029C2ADA9|nr:ABC transporter transmembrane domain-containing protein [Pseudovibrio sp. SPO723]MDX5595446.1 ABC transporter transmembrane domain-containing protein [Pseudovibrio sp. SPO723]
MTDAHLPELEAGKQRKSLKPLAALFPYLLAHKSKVIAATAALITAAAVTLILPIALRYMIDYGFSKDNPELIGDYFLGILVIIAVLATASSLRYYLVMWIGERVVTDLRANVFSHLTNLSASFYDSAKSGELISRLTADTALIKSAFGASASIALRHMLMFSGATIMMVISSPRLSVIVILAIPLIILPLIAFGRSVRSRTRHAQNTLADAVAYATEALGAVRTLQAFTNEDRTATRFAKDTERAFGASLHATKARSILIGSIILIIASSIVGVLWIGAMDVVSGRMTGGELTQFLIYAIIAAGSLSELSQVWGELSQAAGAAERLSELLEIEQEIKAPAKPEQLDKPARGHLVFDNISFSYPTATEAGVLKEVSFEIRHGETVAIVGPSGAGKSTIFQLLMRFYDPQSGEIRVDNHDLRQLDPQDLRSQIALVPQDTAIFAMTVSENISFGRSNATSTQIRDAAHMALADDFILTMKEGYDTLIGERGITLSGGQRQRIAISRAILKDAPILLLDEATSALDAESEKIVQMALDKLMEGRTTLVIAHRLATVLKADRILVMEAGRIVEEGTHDTLVAKGGLYAKLARMQFETGAQALSE